MSFAKRTASGRFHRTLGVEPLEARQLLTASVAQQWNEALLDAIRRDVPNPPVHARNLFHLSAAMYDAWTVFDTQSHGYLNTEKHTAPDVEAARHEAISYAAYRVLSERFGFGKSVGHVASTAQFDALMLELGYDKNFTTTVGDSPAAIGNRIGSQILAYGFLDGANETNLYVDYTGYTPSNPNLLPSLPGAGNVVDPNFWQPLSLNVSITQNGIEVSGNQPYIGTNARWVKPFALNRDAFESYVDPGPQPLCSAAWAMRSSRPKLSSSSK